MPARVAPRRETGIATVLTHDSDDPAAMGDQRRGHLARARVVCPPSQPHPDSPVSRR